ncbi:MAG: aminotransferase class V-fold PLP-dependent enzyme [Anaerolineales bacterium]|nr:aminotransferase class V-fold PLP-dependent enzyme [Anaerolineales bacterium]
MNELRQRKAAIEIAPEEFRKIGYQVVDQLADFLEHLPQQPVTPGETPTDIRKLLGNKSLPDEGVALESLLDETIALLVNHSLFNGHPRFWGYITSSAAPIGALGDFIAGTINSNVGAWIASPVASEIETQTIQWIAEMLGYPSDCGGLLVSGGNVANFVGFLAARNSKVTWDVRKNGIAHGDSNRLIVYCSAETHTWIDKAVDLHGLGSNSARWIKTDDHLQMDIPTLRDQIVKDKKSGFIPFMVVGTAGSTGVGVVDPLPAIAEVCREFDLWFHVDAAYGGFAACLPDAPSDRLGLSEADSVVIDPHKWLYTPLEAGCVLVRDPDKLRDAYSHHPPSYYKFDADSEENPINYYEFGPQNSRGFRALKVWLAFKQVGRDGYVKMISDDIQLARVLFNLVEEHSALEAFTQNLSITTFRYVPEDLPKGTTRTETYLNQLNSELLSRLEKGGEVFLSNAVIRGTYVLRVCIVNFRTSLEDIEALPGIVVRVGEEVDEEIRPEALR